MNLVVTGGVRWGKSTWCAGYCRWLQERDLRVGGIICPEARENGTRTGYDVLDINSGQRMTFAAPASMADFAGQRAGAYKISDRGLEFARGAIEASLDGTFDVVFIDEFGHLELAGRGLTGSAVQAYPGATNTVTVVRHKLLTSFLALFDLLDPLLTFVIQNLELDPHYPTPDPLNRES